MAKGPLSLFVWIVALVADWGHRQGADAQCLEPAPVPNAYRALMATTGDGTWASVKYTCYYGYRHVNGSLHRLCGYDGMFSGEPPLCILDCGDPEVFVDPKVIYSSTLASAAATLMCDKNIPDRTVHGHATNITCNPRLGQWDRPDSHCRYAHLLTKAWQSSTFGSHNASLAVDIRNETCALTSSELTPSWSGSFVTQQILHIFKVAVVTVEGAVDVLINVTGGPIPQCRQKASFVDKGSESARVACDMTQGMFPYGTGIVVQGLDKDSLRQIQLCDIRILGRPFSDRCFNPAVFPRMTIIGEDGTRNYVIGSEVTYACAEGFYYLGGDGHCICDIYRRWSTPTLHCRAASEWPNHAVGMPVDLYSSNGGLQDKISSGALTSDDDMDGHRLTVQYSKSKILRISLPSRIEVSSVTVNVTLPKKDKADLATLDVRVHVIPSADILPSADNSEKHACGQAAMAASRVAVLDCPSRPWGRAVDVRITRNFVNDTPIWIHEMRVFGRRAQGELECLRTVTGAEYKGHMSVSSSGTPCLPWNAVPAVTVPASFTGDGIADGVATMDDVIRLFPDERFADAANFCRNPGGFHEAPFCYVTEKKKEQCPLAMCDQLCSVTPGGTSYAGPINRTASGQPCLGWNNPDIPPARRFQRPEDFSGGNLPAYPACRNPGHSHSEAWCYWLSSGGSVDFETCRVPACPTSLQFAKDSEVSPYALDVCYVSNQYPPVEVEVFRVLHATQREVCDQSDDVTMPSSYFCLMNGVLVGLTVDCDETTTFSASVAETATIETAVISASVTETAVISASVTETAVISASVTETAVISASVTETAVISASVTETAVISASVTETVAVSASVTETAVISASVTETVAISASVTETAVISADATETTVDVTEPTAFSSDIIETSADTIETVAFSSDVTETTAFSADVAETIVFSADVVETTAFSSDVTETTAFSDDVSKAGTLLLPTSSTPSLMSSSSSVEATGAPWKTSATEATTTKAKRTIAGSARKAKLCPCSRTPCTVRPPQPPPERQKLIDLIRTELALETAALSTARRRKESARDERASSRAMGLFGILTLTLLVAVIVGADAAAFVARAGRAASRFVRRGAYRRTGVL